MICRKICVWERMLYNNKQATVRQWLKFRIRPGTWSRVGCDPLAKPVKSFSGNKLVFASHWELRKIPNEISPTVTQPFSTLPRYEGCGTVFQDPSFDLSGLETTRRVDRAVAIHHGRLPCVCHEISTIMRNESRQFHVVLPDTEFPN